MANEIPDYTLSDHRQIKISQLEHKGVIKYFSTHRHSYFEIIIITSCEEGTYSHSIDFKSYPLIAGRIYFIAPGQTHSWDNKEYNKEYKGYLITFNESFILTGHKTMQRRLQTLFEPLGEQPFLTFNPKHIQDNFPTLEIFKMEYHKEKQNYLILRALLETILHYMESLKSTKIKNIHINHQRFIDIRRYIEKYYKEEKNISFYALKMKISSKRLNEISKQFSGQTIIQLIHKRILLEAKREIISQKKTMQNISDELNFENASYFSRFFKKNEGISPTEFLNKTFK